MCFDRGGNGDHRDLHRGERRQRQMCIGDGVSTDCVQHMASFVTDGTALDVGMHKFRVSPPTAIGETHGFSGRPRDSPAQLLHQAAVEARDKGIQLPSGDVFSLVASTFSCNSINQRNDEAIFGRAMPVTSGTWAGYTGLQEAIYNHPHTRTLIRLLHDLRGDERRTLEWDAEWSAGPPRDEAARLLRLQGDPNATEPLATPTGILRFTLPQGTSSRAPSKAAGSSSCMGLGRAATSSAPGPIGYASHSPLRSPDSPLRGNTQTGSIIPSHAPSARPG